MPSEKILEQKKAFVSELAEKMKNASSGVLVDYKGITVENDTKLRSEMRKNNIDYSVIKNSLIRFAAKQVGYDALESVLEGTTALAISMTDPVAPAKLVAEYAKKDKNIYNIKAGFVDGRVISADEVKALADLPSKEVLIAKMLGSMQAPISGFVNVLNGNIRGLVCVLNAIAEKQQTA
ncbi:MAG: 50S ribosomal protein L10 [Clostridiales bacterium]|nr:50S ribosomal protein L10 [Clostridiales bacterium]